MAIYPLALLSVLLCLPPTTVYGQGDAHQDDSDGDLISKAAKQFRTEIGIRGPLRMDPLQEAKRAAMRVAFQKAQLEQQNVKHRLRLLFDTHLTFRLTRFEFVAQPANTESRWGDLRKQLRSRIVLETQKRLEGLEGVCPLDKGQRQKILLAAIADIKPVEREIADWEMRYADLEATAQNVRQALIELRDLNNLLAEQVGEKSLVPKVFLSIITDEQARQLREACLLRFSDVAFAIGIPVEQRPDLMEVLRKQTEALPLTLDLREFRMQVLQALPIEELVRVVGPDYAKIIKQTPLLRE